MGLCNVWGKNNTPLHSGLDFRLTFSLSEHTVGKICFDSLTFQCYCVFLLKPVHKLCPCLTCACMNAQMWSDITWHTDVHTHLFIFVSVHSADTAFECLATWPSSPSVTDIITFPKQVKHRFQPLVQFILFFCFLCVRLGAAPPLPLRLSASSPRLHLGRTEWAGMPLKWDTASRTRLLQTSPLSLVQSRRPLTVLQPVH